ncbi:MAG: radical SAM protein [Bacteroidales bacterium]|nr:radical SAM protein [Bacteroidales bacterium]
MANIKIGLKAFFNARAILHDMSSVIEKLNYHRACNILKLFFSNKLSRITSKYFHSGKPWSLSIETTSVCNLNCPQCACGMGLIQRSAAFIDISLFEHILNDIPSTCFYLNLYFQGEPLLHPRFEELVSLAASKGFYTSISTNAQLIDQQKADQIICSGLNRIIISLDGLTEKDYSSYRIGGEVNKAMNAIAYLNQARKKSGSKKPLIIAQMLLTKDTEPHYKAFYRIAKNLGADLAICKTMQLMSLDENSAKKYLPVKKAFSRYKTNENGIPVPVHNKGIKACSRLWHSAVITSDGCVVPCCYDKCPEYVMGNIGKDRFLDIWNSNEMLAFRKQTIDASSLPSICRNCKP